MVIKASMTMHCHIIIHWSWCKHPTTLVACICQIGSLITKWAKEVMIHTVKYWLLLQKVICFPLDGKRQITHGNSGLRASQSVPAKRILLITWLCGAWVLCRIDSTNIINNLWGIWAIPFFRINSWNMLKCHCAYYCMVFCSYGNGLIENWCQYDLLMK